MLGRCLALAALISAGPAAAQTVEVAGGDWSAIPKLQPKQETLISKASLDRVENIVRSRACKLDGQSSSNIDLTVPFLMQFDSAGSPARVVVARMNCPPLESVLGTVALGLVKSGEYQPTGENPAGWYRSEVSFAIR